MGAHVVGGDHLAGQPPNTKQLMRLLDSIKTLGDENAALLREVEDAEVARAEAKATKEQMRRFRAEYGKRFAALKSALEKFRKSYPEQNVSESNPVTSRYVSQPLCLSGYLHW
jgi:vacuolar-type H+-ATPase subunit I/STV1